MLTIDQLGVELDTDSAVVRAIDALQLASNAARPSRWWAKAAAARA
jgi:hypothetical protein